MSFSFAEREIRTVNKSWYRRFTVPASHRGKSVRVLCDAALRAPAGDVEPVGALAEQARRVVVIVSDETRDEPRGDMLDALLEVVPREKVTLVVASGTHRATAVAVPERHRELPCIVHDATDESRMVDLGTTAQGTRVRILREVAEADLVVATGRIRPHYFAGYSGGAKSIFPGCAFAEDILKNHRLKAHPTARLGHTEDNVCRADMEEAAQKVRGAVLNVLADASGAAVAAASGDMVAAHRQLAREADALFTVRAPAARVVVVADRPPVTDSLYQASKLLPPAGPLLEPGGAVIVVAECPRGAGPEERVNNGIYRLGIVPQLPAHTVTLVSTLDSSRVASTYAEFAPSLGEALERHGVSGEQPAVLLWRAGEMVTRRLEAGLL